MESKINKPLYGLVDRGVFGVRIISGIVIGVQYTAKEPLYCIATENSSVWTSVVADDIDGLVKLLNIPSPKEILAKSKLNINFLEINAK
jgi:hypothetical protein